MLLYDMMRYAADDAAIYAAMLLMPRRAARCYCWRRRQLPLLFAAMSDAAYAARHIAIIAIRYADII